jgi:hypothetical protein
MAQIQAIQNEYDMIRENAEKLRREREAAMQAEQAVSSLAGLTPDSPDYLNQRRQIMTQFPSAILDPRVQSIMDDSDRMYNARQQSEARRQEEITTRAADLVRKGGIDIAKAQEAAKSPLTAAQLEYQFGKPTSSNIGRLEKALGTVQDLIKSVPEEERYDFVDGKQIVRPEFKTLLDRQKKYADMYFNEVEGISPQQEAPTATPTAPATPSVAPAATVTPPAQVTQPEEAKIVVPPAVIQPSSNILNLEKVIQSPEANEDDFSKYISNPSIPLDKKKEALKKFEKMAESPPPRKDLDLDEAMMRREKIQEALNNAKSAVDSQDFVSKYVNPAWSQAKEQLAGKVEAFAKELGVSPENVYNTILKNKKIYSPKLGRVSVAEAILGVDDAHKDNPLVTDAINKLEAVESERRPWRTFAKQLLGEFGGRSNAGVLRALAQEKVSSETQSLPIEQPNVSVAGQPKIEIGKPTKVQ